MSQRFNHQKSVIKVNWTAPAEELNITFRYFYTFDGQPQSHEHKWPALVLLELEF